MDTQTQVPGFRKFATIGICLSSFSIGLSMGVLGPTLIDMTQWLGVTDAMIGYTRMCVALSSIVSSLVANRLFQLFGRHRVIIACLLLHGISQILQPFIRNYPAYIVLNILAGVGFIIPLLGCNVWNVDLYKSRNAAPLQLQNFCNGIGSVTAAVLSGRFLDKSEGAGEIPVSVVTNYTAMPSSMASPSFMNFTLDPSDTPVIETRNYLPVIFGIGSSGVTLTSFYLMAGFTYFAFLRSKRPSASDHDTEHDATKMNEKGHGPPKRATLRLRYEVWIVGWSVFMIGLQMGVELITLVYLPTFFYKMGFDKETGTHLLTAILASFNITRFGSIFVVSRLRPRNIILFLTSLYVISGSSIFFSALYPQKVYWSFISVTLVGVGFSAVIGSLYSYVNSKVPLTNKNSGFIFAFTGIVMAVDPLVVGQFIATLPVILIIVLVSHGIGVLLSVVSIEISFFIFERNPKKYFVQSNNEEEEAFSKK